MRPGMSVVSPRSMTAAPAGCVTCVPASVMRLPVTRTSPGESTLPAATSRMRAACSTVWVGAGCWASAGVTRRREAASSFIVSAGYCTGTENEPECGGRMNRRDAMKLVAAGAAGAVGAVSAEGFTQAARVTQFVERWGKYEIELKGPSAGNPFADASVSAEFTKGARRVKVDGFYDGDDMYRVRWMPDEVGMWQWTTTGSVPELKGKSGGFVCTEPTAENHGPVGVTDVFHFRYA